MVNNCYDGMRITSNNLQDYLSPKPTENSIVLIKRHIIPSHNYLLHEIENEKLGSVITAINILQYFAPTMTPGILHDYIRRYGNKIGYSTKFGIIPLFNSRILNCVATDLHIKHTFRTKYIKNIGFDFKTITDLIDSRNPALLSLFNDGRNYYQRHSVVIMGYEIYDVGGVQKRLLVVCDSWSKGYSYIDYDRLSSVSSLTY